MTPELIILTWKVIHGRKKGRELGFPTANMELLDGTIIIPEHWVYAAKVIVKCEKYISLANIWQAKTFGIETVTVEPHIFDFDEDIYWETIELILYKRLRGMIKFPWEEALIEQLKKDSLEIREYFKQ